MLGAKKLVGLMAFVVAVVGLMAFVAFVIT